MAKTAAYQLAGTNIRVNTICPGMIEVTIIHWQSDDLI